MEQENGIQICPICQHHNEPEAQRCAQCGVSLIGNTTTMKVNDAQVEQVLGDLSYTPPAHREAVAEGLVFYIAGEVQPVIVRGRDEVILGRHVEEGQVPPDVVDLGTYHGHLLGVSRRHARVKLSGEECLLEDLSSTNGTWLNEKRLNANTPYILNNGDQIRLGQLILFVYYSMTSARQKVGLKVLPFATAVLAQKALPVLQLAEDTVAYVRTLVQLQQVIDRIQGRSVDEKRDVTLMEVDGEKSAVNLTMVGLADAVGVVQQVINPWQKQHSALLAALWQGEGSDLALVPETSPLVSAVDVPTELDVAGQGIPDVSVVDEEVAQEAAVSTELGAELGAVQPPTIEIEVPAIEPLEVPSDPFAVDELLEVEPAEATQDVGDAESHDAEPAPDAAGVMAEAGGNASSGAPETHADSAAQDAVLAAMQKALVEQVLRHIKAGFGAVTDHDQVYLGLLKAPVQVLSHSTLEIAKSSY